MDVRCARCGIEYEFDDALISERGTMVRCTECGHQFRVHPSHVIPAEPDEWRVMATGGRAIIFRTLRELQQGISQGEVGRDALLIRGRQAPRPLGSIAELDPFFPTRAGVARQQNTLTGVAPPPEPPSPDPKPAPITAAKVPVARVGLATLQMPVAVAKAEAVRPVNHRQQTALGIGSPAVHPELEPPPGATEVEKPEVEKPDEKPAPRGRRAPPDPPTTLRDGEAPTPADKPAKKTSSVPPPRPVRRTRPTPAAGTSAPSTSTLISESAAKINGQPSPKPAAESPALPRVADTKTKISEQPPLVIEPTEPMRSDEKPTARLRPVMPPAPAADAGAEDASPLFFRAESKPIESPPSSPRIALPASEPSEASFIPTVPPMRATGSRALRLSALAPAQNSRMGRWLMVGLFGVLVSLILVWARHRSAETDPNATAHRAVDLDRNLQAARDALSSGDLVLAHDQLQISQSQGGRDPRWLILTARYDVMRADMNWLAVRIADPNDGPRLEALGRELSDNVAQATRALNAVESIAAAEPEMAAARLDTQRIRGELDRAREAASSLEAPSTSPELAYALAGVELMQQKPRYKEVFDWLGQARAKDSGLGRAPVMLVLACISGDRLENARAEIQRLKLASHSHPLLAELEALVQRTSDSLLTAEQAATADSGTSGIVDAGETEALADVTREGDFRLRLRRAVESLSRNELTRAEQLFRSVLAVRPSDVEALSGLGDVARRHGNTSGAISYYERVLAGNGQYLPALSALADVKFKTGDRGGAAALYRRIVDQVGESSGYGQTAAQRLHELSESSNVKSNNKSDSEKASSPESPSPAASANIDMTDLPGNKP